MSDDYDDDQPGMMRIHIAQARANDLCAHYTRDGLRHLARVHGVPTGYSVKSDLALALALTGVKAP